MATACRYIPGLHQTTHARYMNSLFHARHQAGPFRLLALLVILFAGCTSTPKSQKWSGVNPSTYPPARHELATFSYGDISIEDPYAWMESLEDPELDPWLNAQDALLSDYIADDDVYSAILKRLEETSTYPFQSTPIVRGERMFVTRRSTSQSQFDVYRISPGTERLVLDANGQSGQLALQSISPDGKTLVAVYSEEPGRWKELVVLDVDSGTEYARIPGFYTGLSSLAWSRDSESFHYVQYDVPADRQAALGAPTLMQHAIHAPTSTDTVVWNTGDASMSLSLRVSRDNTELLIDVSLSGGTFNGMFDQVYRMPRMATGAPERLVADAPGMWAFEAATTDSYLYRTTALGGNGGLVALSRSNPSYATASTVIPEDDRAIGSVFAFRNQLVIVYTVDARTVLRITDLDGQDIATLDDGYPSVTGLADNPDSDVAWFGAAILTDPGAIYEIDLETGTRTTYYRPTLNMQPTAFIQRVVTVTREDGPDLPMYLVHRADLELNGDSPVFIYGYGAWAWSAYPWQLHMIPWLEMGGIYAVPNVRGGGEKGAEWHQAGIGVNKENTVRDYIDAMEWLVESSYTSPGLIVANGGSGSAILPAIASQRRPDLVGAAIIDYPALDMIRLKEFGAGESWLPETGDPNNPEDIARLLSLSPYHTMSDPTCLPPTIVQVGTQDNTTTPMHAYKYAAKAQSLQTCDHPILLQVVRGAGHAYGKDTPQSRRTQAQQLSFLVRRFDGQLNVSELGG